MKIRNCICLKVENSNGDPKTWAIRWNFHSVMAIQYFTDEANNKLSNSPSLMSSTLLGVEIGGRGSFFFTSTKLFQETVSPPSSWSFWRHSIRKPIWSIGRWYIRPVIMLCKSIKENIRDNGIAQLLVLRLQPWKPGFKSNSWWTPVVSMSSSHLS